MRMGFALFVLASLIMAVAPGARADLKFLTHSLGDSAYFDRDHMLRGRLHGGRRAFYVEVVTAMMKARGKESTIAEVPLSRGIFLLTHEKDYALFNIIKNDERSRLFKWIGPISVFPTYFYEHVDAPTGVRTVEDAKKVGSICVLRGNNLVRLMQAMGFTNIFLANSTQSCVNLLGYRRVSLIPESRYPQFMTDPILSKVIVRTPVVLSIDEGFIAVSPNVPDAEIAAWQKALDSIKKSGRYDEIVKTYLMPAFKPGAPASDPVATPGEPAPEPNPQD